MNARAFLIIPAVLAMGVLAGCGLTDSGAAGAGTGSVKVQVPSTEICHAPSYMRKRIPEGFCTSIRDTDDYLSPTSGR
ncbi:hypothetical protein ASE14_08810 [Agromyces sp. Root81]|uniref:hypothetical protein n=1 Tax=Agromyces sp. Root81 TaxID=1736601 RepID=UPI0006FDF4B9|nr:hypothetical protein [Agromyces sp. Root81]KRC61041.1 hypothetical protein ASE14_08810 [Agromyces sp. Root81]